MPSSMATVRQQLLDRLGEITLSPKPSYNIDGQNIDWGDYMKKLQEGIDFCDRKLASTDATDGGVFEIESFGIAG